MKKLLKEFNEAFHLLHWRQWSALGLFTYEAGEKNWIIDPEALIVSTLSMEREKRLLEGCKEWCVKNRAWISSSRLRRIAEEFSGSQPPLEKPLLSENLPMLESCIKNKKIKKEGERKTFQPNLDSPPLLLLKLRAVFGVEARSDVFLYFLLGMKGNSYEVARWTYYDQKRVYAVVNMWERAGILEKMHSAKEKIFWLANRNKWQEVFGVEKLPPFVNWPKVFLFLHRINLVLRDGDWQEPYLLSSFFKSIYSDTMRFFAPFGVSFPKPETFPGDEYFPPFSKAILKALRNATSPDKIV